MAPKKNKQEKMNLGEFLTNQSLGSWADEMDSQPIPAMSSGTGYGARDRDGGERRAFTQPAWESARGGSGVGGGLGGRGASFDRPRFSDREQLPLPTKPPFTAHLGNLTYEVTQVDVEEFLKDCQVTNVRIVEDKLDHKPKGFGYVEFGTLDGLKKALTLTEQNFMGRNVKISVAEPPRDRAESTRDFSDWSRKGPLPDAPQATRQPSNRGFNRNFDNTSDAGSDRGGARKPGFFEGDGKTRDFSNWERKGPLSPAPTTGPPVRDSGKLREGGPPTGPAAPGTPTEEQRQGASWGEGRSDTGSRPPRREFESRPPVERVPTAADMDNQWRARMKPDPSPAPTPTVSTPSSPQPEAPKERPRLNLKQRTVSTAVNEQASPGGSDSKASPFGAARPIDTATKEREIEEKRQLALRQKKEADDKAKEDKQAREAATRAARGDRADRGQAQEDDKVTSPTAENGNKNRRSSRQQNGVKGAPKENGDAPAQSRPNFSILRREAEEGEERAGADDDGNANGDIVDDKNVKPQEVVQEAPKDDAAAADATANTENTAEALEEEGWSTVGASNKKNNRRGGARALAS